MSLPPRCGSQFAGTARFFDHLVTYAFEHPYHRHVEMQMCYADMLRPRLTAASSPGGVELQFRIGRPLEYFTREYDHTNSAHHLALGFASPADAERFKELVWPQLLARAK